MLETNQSVDWSICFLPEGGLLGGLLKFRPKIRTLEPRVESGSGNDEDQRSIGVAFLTLTSGSGHCTSLVRSSNVRSISTVLARDCTLSSLWVW